MLFSWNKSQLRERPAPNRNNLALIEELKSIEAEIGMKRFRSGRFHEASDLFSEMILKDEFDEFLTIPAYNLLKRPKRKD